jgi:GTP:adenosylcobinamide-phosphate guanylyltransferase
MNKPTLLILAAGHGSRFGGLKQISEVGQNGESIMDYSIADALAIGFEKIVIVIQDNMLEQLTEKYVIEQRFPVFFSIQKNEIVYNKLLISRKKPWGTAHAVLSAKEHLDQPFLIINADDYYGKNSLKLGFDYLKNHNDNCAVVFPIEQTLSQHGSVNRAEVKVVNGLLDETIERLNIASNENGIYYENDVKNQLSKDTIVSMNLWGLSVDFLKSLEKGFEEFLSRINGDSMIEYQLPTIINNAIHFDDLIVKTFITNEEWIGLTYKEDVILAKQKFNELYKLSIKA